MRYPLLLTEFLEITHKHAHTRTHTHTRTLSLTHSLQDSSLARLSFVVHLVGPRRTTVAVPALAERAGTGPVVVMEIWISLPTTFSVVVSGLRYLR